MNIYAIRPGLTVHKEAASIQIIGVADGGVEQLGVTFSLTLLPDEEALLLHALTMFKAGRNFTGAAKEALERR